LLLHNVWSVTDGTAPQGRRTNYIGNFKVTYANGRVNRNALPSLRPINDDSPFTTDFEGNTLQPSDLNDVFDGGNVLSVSPEDFDPGNGAQDAYYWSDLSQSSTSESQGFGIFSFEESSSDIGITEIEFTWVGNTVGTNTAFIGLAANVVPEPSGGCMVIVLAILAIRRSKRP